MYKIMSGANSSNIADKLNAYKKKYYINLLLKGLIFTSAMLLSIFIFINVIEYFGRLGNALRAILFFIFIGGALFSFLYWIIDPVIKLLFIEGQLSNEQAARQIGVHFKSIEDKLLNTLQLQSNTGSNQLLTASLEQRTHQLEAVNFSDAIRLEENNKYIKYIFIPALIILFVIIFKPSLFSGPSSRIVNFSKVYSTPAPFSFYIGNQGLTAFKDEDFVIDLKLNGQALPENIYLIVEGRKIKMQQVGNKNYKHIIYKIQKSTDFHFEGAGFTSDSYSVVVKERPALLSFDASLNFPAYLKKKNEELKNAGNMIVPEGTKIKWKFNVSGTEAIRLNFQSENAGFNAILMKQNLFEFERQVRKAGNYQVQLKNKEAFNKDEINYYIEVVPDMFPKITLEQVKDTLLFNYLLLGGNISDDYGFSKLSIIYKVMKKGDSFESSFTLPSRQINIPINYSTTYQKYFYQWAFDSLQINPGDRVEYFLQVYDNDGVNGPKATRSSINTFSIPGKDDLEKDIESRTSQANSKMNGALNESQKLKNELSELENRLKSKKTLDYQDKKMIEELLKKKKEQNDNVESLQKDLNQLKEKNEKFAGQSPKISDKIEKLQKLMDQLLDEETKKLYEELRKLLEQNKNNNTNDLLNKIDKKEANLEKELERAIEMFKQLQVEQKIEKQIADLKKLAKEQENLSEKTKEKDSKADDLNKEQENLKQLFEEEKKNLEELKDNNKKLETPSEIPDTKEEEKGVAEDQEKSQEALKKNQKGKSAELQKKAADKMKKMAEKMEDGMSKEEQEQNQENIDDLRKILENLLTLSFDQEKVMKEFKNVATSDPKFLKLSQEQLKIKEDGKIIEDSLTALSKRVYQIESFVTRELSQMKDYMDESIQYIKQRRIGPATGKQQLSMTSMNNLALMLDDVLQKMQNQAQQQSGSKKKSKPKKNQPGISELQKQLNQKIQELKKGGLSGKNLSEELAKLAQEQEMIRKMLQESGGKEKGEKGEGGKEAIMKQMEEIEKDLVNKNINQNTVKRQQEILTRLLESEKADKEREEDPERKAEQAKDKKRTVTATQFDNYLKLKQDQTELLKTVPPSLSPYYKKEVDKYFKKIE